MKQSYSDQLKSPKWQKRRLEILNLHGFKCENCGSEEKTLNVHHRFYLKGRKAWEYDNDVFQVLCEDCHAKEHKPKEHNYPEMMNSLIELILQQNKECDEKLINWLGYSLTQSINYPGFFGLLARCFGSPCIEKIYRELQLFVEFESQFTEIIKLEKEINDLKLKDNG